MTSSSDVPARVFVLAPQLVRWGLQRLLQASAPRIDVGGSSSPLPEAVREVADFLPDVVIVYAEHYPLAEAGAVLRGTCGSIVALQKGARPIAPPAPTERAVCVSTRTNPAAFVRAVLEIAGSTGVWRPAGAPLACVRASSPARLHAAMDSGTATCQVEALTPKQREIVRALSLHASSPAKVIAAKLNISEHTLRNHLSEIYSRLGVKRRTHLQAVVAGQVDAFPLDPCLWPA